MDKRVLVYFVRAALVGLSLMLTACVPWPHHEQYTPQIYGVVTQNGQPVAGAEISVSLTGMNGEQYSEKRTAITDAQGQFGIDPISEFHFFAYVAIGDRFYNTNLIVKSAGKEYLGYEIPGSLGDDSVKFECELGQPIPNLKRDEFCKPSFSKIGKD